MGKFGKSRTQNFSLVEVLVLLLTIILIVFIVWPNVKKIGEKIKMDNAIDSVYAYKDNISKYYVSQLIYDTDFKLNGKYNINGSNLSSETNTYNLHITGNVPKDGYLEYENNILKEGCILIDDYYVTVNNESINITNENCMAVDEVDVALNLE